MHLRQQGWARQQRRWRRSARLPPHQSDLRSTRVEAHQLRRSRGPYSSSIGPELNTQVTCSSRRATSICTLCHSCLLCDGAQNTELDAEENRGCRAKENWRRARCKVQKLHLALLRAQQAGRTVCSRLTSRRVLLPKPVACAQLPAVACAPRASGRRISGDRGICHS